MMSFKALNICNPTLQMSPIVDYFSLATNEKTALECSPAAVRKRKQNKKRQPTFHRHQMRAARIVSPKTKLTAMMKI